MDYRSLILLVTAVLHGSLGAFVYRQNPRSALHRSVLLVSSLFGLWALVGVAIWSPWLHADPMFYGRLAHVLGLACCTGFVSLGLVYPGGQTGAPVYLRTGLWVAWAIVSAAVISTPDLIQHAELKDGTLHASYGPLRYAFHGHLFLSALWGTGDLLCRFRRMRGLKRLRTEYLLAGCALTALLNVPSDMIGPLLGFHSAGWLGPAWSLAFVGAVAHAIVRHRLMGIRVVVGRGVAQVLSLSLAGGVFLALLWVTNQLTIGTQRTVFGIAALVTALVFQPIRMRVQEAVLRYFYRPPYDYQSTVRDASRALAATLDLDGAIEYLLRTVCTTLGVERSMVLLRDRPTNGFRLRAFHSGWAGGEEEAPGRVGLAGASPLVALLETHQEPVVCEELASRFPGERGRSISADMVHFGAEVAAPLFSGNALWALLFVGPKISGDVFTSQDIDLLSTLGAEAAGAIVNAQLHEDAMQADRLATLGGLAAGIAHEVKNPLVAVKTFAELLPERHGDAEFRESFSLIVLEEVERIDRLIGQLLSFARPQPPRLEPIDLNKTIHDTLQLLAYEASRRSVALVDALEPDVPRVMADASQIKQVVLNIALNALQAMPEGGTLRIITRSLRSRLAGADEPYLLVTGERVEMVFANTGPRIAEEHLSRLFEPFFSTRTEGTGLGLSICKRIVTEHNGEIRAALTDDGLTAFIIHLPAADSAGPRLALPVLDGSPADLAAVGGARG